MMGFDPYNRVLKIWESIWNSNSQHGVHLGVWRFIPSHSLALLGACEVTPEPSFWPATLRPLRLGCEHKARVAIGNISWENYFLKGNTIIGDKCNVKWLNHTLSINCNGKFFSQSKGQGLAESRFATHHPFCKVFL
jgi:hypothetical protein